MMSVPALTTDCELSEPVSDILCTDISYDEAWILLRIFEEPVGYLRLPFHDSLVSAAQILDAAQQFRAGIESRVRACGGDPNAVFAGMGTTTSSTPPFQLRHKQLLTDGPAVTVVICTHGRPESLPNALDSLREQSYRNFDVLVIDNAPVDAAVREYVATLPEQDRVRCVVEPRKGLSQARNCAIAHVTAPIVAWMDDDEIADKHWLMELVAGFDAHPEAVAVSGLVVPAEVASRAQLWFEQYGGHTKGRGFEPILFDATAPGAQSPLFPLPPFGVGANMAFRLHTLREFGFDNAMGAGSLTRGCEDTLIFSRILLAKQKTLYQPSSVMRHYHRGDRAALEQQMYGYGTALTAFYTALLRFETRQFLALTRLIPAAADVVRGRGENNMLDVPVDFPAELLKIKRKGMLAGPVLYMRSAYRARAARRSPV